MKSSLSFSSQPRFVASGDLNNDNLIDVVVANSVTNTIGIFISQGNGTFGSQQTYSTGPESRPYSVAVNDFNNDSYADIIVANYNHNNIGLFFGYGNGTFDDQELISLGSSRPLFVTTGDFNNDNRIDIAVANNGTHTISILLGYGNGLFQDQTTYFTGYDSFPSSLAIGDFNNDTYLDITVANYGTSNIGIFLNYGNGLFTKQEIYSTKRSSNPSSIAVGDFNHDNILDIVVANYGAGNVGIFFGHGNGTFLPQVSSTIGSNAYPQYVAVSNVNKNNILDIVVVDSQHNRIHFLPGYGNGSFARIATYDGVFRSMPVSIIINDFNNNSQADIVAINYGTNNIVVLMDYFAKPSARQKYYRGGDLSMLTSVAIDDFDGDGIYDLVFNPGSYITILMGLGYSTFGDQRTYSLGDRSNPQYICTGDLNNDKKIDIIIADMGLDCVHIILGYGNGSFGNMTTYSTGIGSATWWVDLGDLNADNVLDIVSANPGTNSIGILLGNGDGRFTLTTSYSVKGPLSVATGDFNNDNRLDIAVSTELGEVVIFLGQGDSTFIIMSTYLTGFDYISYTIALGNFNRDNYLDIVVTNEYVNTVAVLLGYGNGTFVPPTAYFTGIGSQPFNVIVVDCNNDNISDLVTTLFGADEVIIHYGYGNGSFEIGRRYSTGFSSKPFGIVAADLDNDTNVELIVALFGRGDIAILTEYNAAEFANKIVYSTGSAPQPTSVAVGDFNNDNQSDIVVANSGTDTLGILLATKNGTFRMEMMYPIGTDSFPQYVITCDINNDNQMDIVSVNSKINSISVIMGYGNGSFAEQIIYSTGDKSYPSDVVAGDVNNDNRLDLVIVNEGTGSISILFGYDYTSFESEQAYSSIDNVDPRAVVVSDFNNDNIEDIAAIFTTSETLCILLGYGNGSFTIVKTYSLPNGSKPWAIAVGDFNKDNLSDIVIANSYSYNIGVLLGYGNGSFSTIILYPTGGDTKLPAIACADFNNDSQLDVVVINGGSNTIAVLLGYGNGSFAINVIYPTAEGSVPSAIAIGDFNNDSRLDIAVANYGTYTVGVLLGYGNGTFADQVTFSSGFPSNALWISVGDFNRDNQLDIATANYNAESVSILLGYGNGSFASVVKYSVGVGSLPKCICVGDFNNDNILDIAVANSAAGNIVVLFGFGDGSFLLGPAYSTGTGSIPWELTTGHFNSDGRLDIVVVNSQFSTVEVLLGGDSVLFGSMTKSSIGHESQPHSVALGDFNNDGWLDAVVANYGTNNIGILFGYRHGNFQDIQIYSTGNDSGPYFVAVAYLNNDTYLDIVVTNSKTDNIAIFFNDGDGNFHSGRTYSTGIGSRPYTVTISDFNKDNISDIVVANSGTNNVLVLYGYGNGTFGNQTSYPFGYEYRPYSTAARPNENGWIDIVIACFGTDRVETLTKMC